MKKIMIVLAVLVAVTALTGIQAASAGEMQPAEVVEAIYAAVEAGDVDAAVDMLAEDAVFILAPLPEWMDGPYVGKEEIGTWYEGLVAENGRYEFSNVESNGNMAAMRLAYYSDHFDKVLGGPAEFDCAAVVQHGLLKSITLVDTPEFTAKMAAADRLEANEVLVHRFLEEMWDEGNMETAEEILADDFVDHNPRPGNAADKAGIMEDAAGFAEIGLNNQIEDLFVTDDAIAMRVTVTDPRSEAFEVAIFLGVEDGQITDRRVGILGWGE